MDLQLKQLMEQLQQVRIQIDLTTSTMTIWLLSSPHFADDAGQQTSGIPQQKTTEVTEL